MNHLRLAAALAVPLLVPFVFAQEKPAAPSAQASEAVGKRTAPINLGVANLMVGIVDLSRVIEQYPKAIEMQKRLFELGKTSRARLDTETQRMEEVQGALKVLGADAPDRRQHENELQMLQLRRQLLAKSLDESFDLERVKMMVEVYSDIEVAIRKVAKARGLHLVQSTHDEPTTAVDFSKLAGRDAVARLQQFETRTIWYAATELDVTGDLIKELMVPVEAPAPKPGTAPADGKDAGKAPGGKPQENGAPASATGGGKERK